MSSLVCLSWSGCDKTNNFILFIASLLNCLPPSNSNVVTRRPSPAENLLYPLLTALPCSEICWSTPLLWLWSQLPFVTTLLMVLLQSKPRMVSQRLAHSYVTVLVLYSAADECPYWYEARHPVTQGLGNWIRNWWCQTRKPAKLAQSGQKSTLCLVFAPVCLIHLMGTWVFFSYWIWERWY